MAQAQTYVRAASGLLSLQNACRRSRDVYEMLYGEATSPTPQKMYFREEKCDNEDTLIFFLLLIVQPYTCPTSHGSMAVRPPHFTVTGFLKICRELMRWPRGHWRHIFPLQAIHFQLFKLNYTGIPSIR